MTLSVARAFFQSRIVRGKAAHVSKFCKLFKVNPNMTPGKVFIESRISATHAMKCSVCEFVNKPRLYSLPSSVPTRQQPHTHCPDNVPPEPTDAVQQ